MWLLSNEDITGPKLSLLQYANEIFDQHENFSFTFDLNLIIWIDKLTLGMNMN